MHPSGLFAEALIDEELPPRDRTIGVQAFLAHHVDFRAEEERRMRVDVEESFARGAIGRRDGEAVRSSRLLVASSRRPRESYPGIVAVEGFELSKTDAFDVAPNAAFAERQRHPGLEMGEHFGLDLRVGMQVVVQAVGIGVHQPFQPIGTALVLALQIFRVDEELHAQIAIDLRLSFGLRQPPHPVEVVHFHPVEVVFGLRIHDTEDGIRVCLAVDVRDTPVVTNDGDVVRLLLPASDFTVGRVGLLGRLAAAGRNGDRENEYELLHR